MNSQSYEFDSSQNQLIQDLAQKMRLVSYFLIVLGSIIILGGLFTLVNAFRLVSGYQGAESIVRQSLVSMTGNGVGNVIQGTIQILIGSWTLNAARSFRLIVDTQGNDITNLMGALGELRKLYTLQYWVVLIGLIVLVLALFLGLFAGLTQSGGATY